jgi:hypothetical protein
MAPCSTVALYEEMFDESQLMLRDSMYAAFECVSECLHVCKSDRLPV